jgi:hypothetical protein
MPTPLACSRTPAEGPPALYVGTSTTAPPGCDAKTSRASGGRLTAAPQLRPKSATVLGTGFIVAICALSGTGRMLHQMLQKKIVGGELEQLIS